MGNVAISLKIMADSPQTDLNKVKDEISKRMKVQDSKIEPVAFGLKSLKILVIVQDSSGEEKLQEEIRNIKGVASVEVESATLI